MLELYDSITCMICVVLTDNAVIDLEKSVLVKASIKLAYLVNILCIFTTAFTSIVLKAMCCSDNPSRLVNA